MQSEQISRRKNGDVAMAYALIDVSPPCGDAKHATATLALFTTFLDMRLVHHNDHPERTARLRRGRGRQCCTGNHVVHAVRRGHEVLRDALLLSSNNVRQRLPVGRPAGSG